MIAYLDGILAEKAPSSAVMDVHGVGYEVAIPLSTFDRLPAVGERTKLFTRLEVREDAQQLFGFATERERRLFALVTSVSGIGPKLALSALSGLSPAELERAVAAGDAKRIASVKGIGKKTAERLVIELKDKIDPIAAFAAEDGAGGIVDDKAAFVRDAMSALAALGMSEESAREQVQRVLSEDPSVVDTETLVRRALGGR